MRYCCSIPLWKPTLKQLEYGHPSATAHSETYAARPSCLLGPVLQGWSPPSQSIRTSTEPVWEGAMRARQRSILPSIAGKPIVLVNWRLGSGFSLHSRLTPAVGRLRSSRHRTELAQDFMQTLPSYIWQLPRHSVATSVWLQHDRMARCDCDHCILAGMLMPRYPPPQQKGQMRPPGRKCVSNIKQNNISLRHLYSMTRRQDHSNLSGDHQCLDWRQAWNRVLAHNPSISQRSPGFLTTPTSRLSVSVR